MRFLLRALPLALAALLLAGTPVVRAADATLDKAGALLDAGSPQAAYDLLAPLQSQRAGEPQYDYLLGVAALDTGRNTEAVFAFERVLAVQPNDAAARAQIARAYFNLKETESAKREFETVRQQDLPQEVRDSINRYLSAIDQIAEAERFSTRIYVEFVIGYDTNVNGATNANQFAVPSLPNITFTLASNAQKTSASFMSAATGLAFRNPFTSTWSMIGGMSAYKRVNYNEGDLNTGYLDGYLGVAAKSGRSTFSAIGQGNIFLSDAPGYNEPYRNAMGTTLQWVYDADARNQFTVYGQYANLSYPQQSPRDANRYIAGMGYAYAFRRWEATVYSGLYGGVEQTKNEEFDYLGYDVVGGRLGGQIGLTENLYAFVNGAAEWRGYQGKDPFFLVTREDRQYSAVVGLHRLLANGWRVSPQVSYLNNISNIVINEYDRWQAFVSLRRDW